MPWFDPSPRLALILRRWRSRHGIDAPRVAVRPCHPWYAKAFPLVVLVTLLLVAAIGMIRPEWRQAGLKQADELRALHTTKVELEEEVARLRGMLAARENDLQIQLAAQRSLADKHKALLEENAKLREELAVLQKLIANARKK